MEENKVLNDIKVENLISIDNSGFYPLATAVELVYCEH